MRGWRNDHQPSLGDAMINIQNTQTIYYDQDKNQVTVYGDFDDPNKWYIVPAVRFAKVAGS
jgi:dolichyl-phosphate-mannose--protein O-mannosyl transferase